MTTWPVAAEGGQTIGELWEEERRQLLPLPAHTWPCYLIRQTLIVIVIVTFDRLLQ